MGKFKWVLVGVVVFIALGISYYFTILNKTLIVNEEGKQAADEINSIQQYLEGEFKLSGYEKQESLTVFRSDEMGFEVSIPSNWIGEPWNEGVCLKDKQRKYYFESDSPDACAIYITKEDRFSKTRTNFRDLVESWKNNYPDTRVMSVDVDNVDGVFTDGFFGLQTFVFKDEFIWTISFSLNKESYPEEVAVYPKILKTLKFL